MKQLLSGLLVWLLPVCAFAQFSITGKVTSANDNQTLIAANVQLLGTKYRTITDADGNFAFDNIPAESYDLKVSILGYQTFTQKLTLKQNTTIEIALEEKVIMTEQVIVNALRATDKTAMTFTNLDKEVIEKQNFGQDMPFLLAQTPSMVVTSDAGAGVGYTGMRIRGSDATRINVTVNGIPLNDSESHNVFWVNMPDFASSVDQLQVQRGVGTSTNGAAAFGASVNIQTENVNPDAYAEINNAYGTFNTMKNTVKLGTGLIDDKFAFDVRLSNITSDGYVDRAFSDLKSLWVSGGYYGESTMIKLNAWTGKEKTYQSWWGVPEYLLEEDRTYNYYTYENQTDNYQQDHYQLILAQDLSDNWTLNGALHYTKGRGYYEEYKEGEDPAHYQLVSESGAETDLIRQRWLDNDFYGFTLSLNYASDRLSLNIGGAANEYVGDHFGEVIWAETASPAKWGDRYYFNEGKKQEANTYVKASYQLSDKLNLYGDLQYRYIHYRTEGNDNDLVDINTGGTYNFVNPKFGINYQMTPNSSLYASYSIGNREPVRSDFVDALDGVTPKHETLRDFELGYRFRNSNTQLNVNYYLMDYTNQLVVTGELNDVGSNIRTNVDDSYRMGIELDGSYAFNSKLSIAANLALSINKIAEFTEVVYDYTEGTDEFVRYNTYEDTDIAFSPSVVGGAQLNYRPFKNFEVSFISKYVGDQYLDNTSNENRKLDAYFVNDLRFSYSIKPRFMKSIDLACQINNIFNHTYEANGYTFSYYWDNELITENYYYPQAGTNVMFSVSMKL
ncbi:TonB-dependent receptor [Sediminitomix flava]|uniref:Iron complex outermembrane receptor protein n=1 Tax=Sediminitomix flava TaxID=379075 RepID=A0A315ZHY8_SEDFL|nr:TonB-dependent receptor [Sediminitomix flava]PWJ44428.1 iron complex outermembrane receptor protein [Sediminitomix flava]